MRLKVTAGLLLLQLLTACHSTTQTQLTIATASNLQFVMEDLTQSFKQVTGIPCQTIVSSSGKLTAQIRSGAPYDVLLSADMKYPDLLHQEGLTQSKPKVYAFGQLVLWSQKKGLEVSESTLTDPQTRNIAIANPQTAPYGQAALASLKNMGILKEVQSKLVYGDAIAQVNQFVTTKAVDVGFTSKSVVLSPRITGQGSWSNISEQKHPPIAQGVVVLKGDSSRTRKAQKFQEFLFTTPAQTILKRYGYRVNL